MLIVVFVVDFVDFVVIVGSYGRGIAVWIVVWVVVGCCVGVAVCVCVGFGGCVLLCGVCCCFCGFVFVCWFFCIG